jgi:cobyrinic acid a,c-diamide synthase
VKLLHVPLLLVLDCSKASRTIAALVHGCETFDRDLPLKGIILNQIAGERHRKTITEAVEKYCRTPVLGAIPRLSDLSLEERSLGLVPAGEHNRPDEIIKTLGDIVAANTDIEAILRFVGADGADAAARGHPVSAGGTVVHATDGGGRPARKKRRVGIIRDAAFSFYYAENLEALRASGAEIVEINSLADRALPPVDALYIGGGFPEAHAAALGRNRDLRESLKGAVAKGLLVYAECGGLIYLSRAIIICGTSHPMTGIFPFVFEISKQPVGHGYTLFEVDGPNPFYKNGAVVRGHEFRYARITNTEEIERVRTVFRMERGMGIGNGRDGILRNNCLAAFTHTHAGSDNVQWINALAAGGDAE